MTDDTAIQIYVDVDACPVKDEVVRVGERHGLVMHFVSNAWMRLPEGPLIKRVIVPDGPDVADNWIAERAGPRDVVVTSDIPLAARVFKNGARIVTQYGKRLTDKNIGMAIASRNLMQDLREAGVVTSGNASFSRAARSDFLQALEQAVQEVKRGG